MKKQTVYVKTDKDEDLAVCYFSSSDSDWVYKEIVKEKEAYVFTPEELKQLLQDYTDKIVANVFAQSSRSNMTSRNGLTCINSGDVSVNKESITSQLPEFLKEIGYE